MSPSNEPVTRITVFGHADQEVCLISGCGSSISSVEMTDEFRVALSSLFGTRVALAHYDLSQPDFTAAFSDILQGTASRNLPFPLIAINGAIVLAGPSNLDQVLRKLNDVLS